MEEAFLKSAGLDINSPVDMMILRLSLQVMDQQGFVEFEELEVENNEDACKFSVKVLIDEDVFFYTLENLVDLHRDFGRSIRSLSQIELPTQNDTIH